MLTVALALAGLLALAPAEGWAETWKATVTARTCQDELGAIVNCALPAATTQTITATVRETDAAFSTTITVTVPVGMTVPAIFREIKHRAWGQRYPAPKPDTITVNQEYTLP